MAIVETLTYVGEIEDVIDAEFEDFMFELFNEISDEGMSQDEFHETFFLHGGWADPMDLILSVFKDCGLEW